MISRKDDNMKEFNEIIKESRPTLVDFYATWCGPCRHQMPIIEKVKDSCGDRANVIKIDVDKDRELASQYRIQSIPTIVVFKSGEVVWRASGLQSYDKLMSVLSQMSGND